MQALFCEAVGCPTPAAWAAIGTPNGYFEEYLCDLHMALYGQLHPRLRGQYRQLAHDPSTAASPPAPGPNRERNPIEPRCVLGGLTLDPGGSTSYALDEPETILDFNTIAVLAFDTDGRDRSDTEHCGRQASLPRQSP